MPVCFRVECCEDCDGVGLSWSSYGVTPAREQQGNLQSAHQLGLCIVRCSGARIPKCAKYPNLICCKVEQAEERILLLYMYEHMCVCLNLRRNKSFK